MIAFGELIEHAIGGGWGEAAEFEGARPVRVIRGADFPNAELQVLADAPIRFEERARVPQRTLQVDDIVLEISGGTKDRPTGRVVRATADLLAESDVPVIPASFCRLVRIDKRAAYPAYVYYALRDLYARGGTWEFQNQSTGLSNFQFTLFAERWKLDLPALDDQMAIAEVLGALDDKIAANERLAVATDQFLEAEFGRISAGAATTTLAAIAEVDTRSVKPKNEGELRYLDISSVGVGRYDFPARTPWSTAPGRARRWLQEGDTVWSTVRPNRRSHALILDKEPLIGSTGLAVLRSSRGQFATLYESTRRQEFTAFLEAAAEGSAYPAVRAARFLEAPVPDLGSEVAGSFEELGSALRRRSHAGAIENRTLAELRDTLLPALMSGRLSVKDAESTVSEVV